MPISPTTRLYQARLQVFRARERLRNVPEGAAAYALLESALNDLDNALNGDQGLGEAVDPLLGVAGR